MRDVLLLSHSRDFYTIDRVGNALERQGARPFRLNTDRLGFDAELSIDLDDARLRGRLSTLDGEVRTEDIQAVWTRQVAAPQPHDVVVDPTHRERSARQLRAALRGWLDLLRNARWINALGAIEGASSKVHQLASARRAGLAIPRTLVTSDPTRLRTFFEDLEGRVVTKLLAPLVSGMSPGPASFRTSRVRREDLEHADSLRSSPMIFQEELPKTRELRVVYVAGRLFVGAIDVTRSTAGRVDWRKADPAECRWAPGQLPPEEANRIDRLMRALGLELGALDLIVTPDGRHVFLEVNATGEWGMLERDLDLGIAAALAAALLAVKDDS